MNLGGRIRNERESLGWTQEELARRAGLAGKQQTIQALESRDSVRSQYAPQLCAALGLSLEWALSGKGSKRASGDTISTPNEIQTGSKRLNNEGGLGYKGSEAGTRIESNLEGPASGTAEGFSVKRERYAPVVGRAKGGADGYFVEEQYPVGFSNEWVPTVQRDENAFGLRVVGDSMSPRLRHGEYILVSPNRNYETGNFIYVCLRDGRRLFKQLGRRHSDAIELLSVNLDHAPLTVLLTDIEHIYRAFGPIEPDQVIHA